MARILQSYLRLPRYQRVLIGVAGLALGWYGPSLMTYLFIDPGPLGIRGRTDSNAGSEDKTSLSNTKN